jgi:hypothetical protein
VTILLTLGAFGVATASQAQTAAPVAGSSAPNSFCGSQSVCYETADFAATITDFRTSTQGYYKIIDIIVRFQNKTNHPLILGYVAGSGTAMDDRGNRYAVGGGNAFRGIGQVYGNNFDPKFNLPTGGLGDAQFELLWSPGQQVYGLTFELNLTVDEINIVEGNQHTLGGEFPLHYRGLANGVSGAAPGQVTAFSPQGQGVASSLQGLPPCGQTATTLAGAANSAGGQIPAGANTAVSNATAAISSFGSLFGKKKAAAPAAPSAAATVPCAPAATAVGTPMIPSVSTPNAVGTQTTGVAASTSTAPGLVTKSPPNAAGTQTTSVATPTRAALGSVTKIAAAPAARPMAAVAKAPAPAANAVAKKPAAILTPQKATPANQ